MLLRYERLYGSVRLPPDRSQQRIVMVRRKPFVVVFALVFAFCCMVLYGVAVDSSFLPRRISYDKLALWFKPWRQWPVEEDLYRGTAGLHRRPEVDHSDSGQFPGLDAGDDPFGSESIVSCRDVDRVSFPSQVRSSPFTVDAYPAPSFGLAELSGCDPSDCLDSATRLGPYRNSEGGTGNLWGRADLSTAQDACLLRNRHRFSNQSARASTSAGQSTPRTAVVLRAYDSFEWSEDDVANVRAMFTELSLWSGGEYQLIILLHIKDAAEVTRVGAADLKKRYLPERLQSIAEIWSYNDCVTAYPNVGEYEVYFHTWMPVQLFALRHPEFNYVWNFEMDVRSLGHYGELLTKISGWAGRQSKPGLEQRNRHLYIPSYHGSWDDFSAWTQQLQASEEEEKVAAEDRDAGPSGQAAEDVDLITFFPIFDPAGTDWQWRNYLVNYTPEAATRPRRAAIGTNHRLSRELLIAMHHENEAGRAMMAEMWPTSVAYQQRFTSVFAPVPVWLDRRWPADELQTVFNSAGGAGMHVGGSKSRKWEGATWFFNAKLPLELYRRWLGVAESGPGSHDWSAGNGALCLPGMLLHPVKADKLRG